MIKQQIERLLGNKMYCTPGHKGLLLDLDITEIDGSFPLDFVSVAEKKVAGYFGAKAVRFLTAGSSIGVKAALLGAGDLLVQKNSHKSVLDAATLGGARVFFIQNDTQNGLGLPPTQRQITDALAKYPSVKTVVLTSPDYYGFMASEGAAKAVIDAGKRLHIDGAHGAHMFFRPDLFDTSAFRLAHSFNLSAHKTMPAYTGTAYLCINDDEKRIDTNLSLLGTTSPFYPFMACLEEAADQTWQRRAEYDGLFVAVKALKSRIKCAENHDFSRLVVDGQQFSLSGEQLYQRLRERRIIAEKFDERYVVFIVTINDTPAEIATLTEELCQIKGCL